MTGEPDESGEPLEPVDRPEEAPATVDAADPAEAKRRATRRQLEERQRAEFWRNALADPIGRQELYRLLSEAGTFRVQFAAGPTGVPDSNATWYHGGRRDLGLQFYHEWMLFDREGVLKMLDEHDPRFNEAKAS